ncbi:MAG: hypothetical protein GX895_03385 [Clostridiales bacterium]|uniref:hypothetical protein n=1 Tax=Clostridium sp. N3C TaxID=1776758 RepID=UPI00092DF922|nr:hypothetical protein [Clostridium sp. N3C]NLZ47824.1 hypothetical protein [Clostridiales bacterium]SCN22349.1 hypothetical protein N3C_0716 [Clostridium sp. N3C]
MDKIRNYFKKIHRMSINEIHNNFQYLGEGISRIVYAIDDHWVVKVAKGMEGLYQNKVELYVYKHAGSRFRKYLCPIVWYKPDMIFMPRAIPLSKIYKGKKVNLKTIRPEANAYKDLLTFIEKFYMLFEDIEATSSWGLLNLAPVLIDYGCTDEKGDAFYDSIQVL